MLATLDGYKRIVVDGVRHYGKHQIVNAARCNERLLDKAVIAQFMTDLVDRIDMVAFGDPIVERFGEGIEVGISAVQLIQTSAIVIHTNDNARDLYLDVFSCKDFDADTVSAIVNEYFAPESAETQVFLRK